MKFEVSAPGKVILFGEHAVVYGSMAIAASIDIRTSAKVFDSSDFSVVLSDLCCEKSFPLSDLNVLFTTMDLQSAVKLYLNIGDSPSTVQSSLFSVLYQYASIFTAPFPIRLVIKSELPPGGGVGSSAAFSVCISTAFLYASSQISKDLTEKDLKTISERAFNCEKLFHSKPSGIDNSICTYGGCLTFQNGTIKHLDAPPIKILLINSGVSRSTKDLVERVRNNIDRFPSVYDHIFQAITKLVHIANNDLTIGNINKLKELIPINQGLLYSIDVSHEKLDMIINIAKAHGIAAKLTGAGGGGFSLALINGISESVLQSFIKKLEENGFRSWVANACSPGVKISQE